MSKHSISKYAALGGLLALLGAGEARADRACEADPATTGRMCPVAVCLSMQAEVNSACKSPAPRSCNTITGCYLLKQEKAKWLACYVARSKINATCWGGGDAGHQQAQAQAIQNVSTCDAKIALPEPVGCADPCP